MFTTPLREAVTLLGTDIQIEIDDNKLDAQGADGLYQHELITLRSSYSDHKEFRRVYIHECVHALCDLLGIQLDVHTEEVLAHRISYMIAYEL